jgi:hypothetical protein
MIFHAVSIGTNQFLIEVGGNLGVGQMDVS